MSVLIRRAVCAGVLVLFVFALARAASYKFREKEDAIRTACRADMQRSGLTPGALKAKYPTPEIHMVTPACILPGKTGEVVVRGKFTPGTKFVFENDNIEVLKESLVGGEYRATVQAAPGVGPQSAGIVAISSGRCQTAQQSNAVIIGGNYEWTINTTNGWRIIARSRPAKACGHGSDESIYDLAFYRGGEATPFEKRTATLYHSLWESMNYRFRVSEENAQAQAQQDDLQALAQQMSNPNLTDAQRNAIMKKFEAMQQQMVANMQKMTDPAYVKQQQALQQQARDQFGCETIEMAVSGATFTGQMRCSQKVGLRIGLTGNVRPM